MLQQALDTWATHFDGSPTVISRAPGRVNLIGEHTDYNEGYVFPAALDLAVTILARRADEDRLYSVQVPDSVDHRGPGWRRYVDGCRRALAERGIDASPIEAVVTSSVPGGSGLSSSAALQVAVLTALNHLDDIGLSASEVAELAWRSENEFIGVKVGRMDQIASAMGVADHALFVDMRSLDVEPVPIPSGVEIAILDTRKTRSLAAGKYNERVAECARAAQWLGVKSLRDANLPDLDAAKLAGLDTVAYRRAKHVLSENQRTVSFRNAFETRDLQALGTICQESHLSLRDDYEVTVPELDSMVRSATRAPGCIAARMTGAGFGGCCVALIEQGSFAVFKQATVASYGMYGFPAPHVFAVKASEGATARPY